MLLEFTPKEKGIFPPSFRRFFTPTDLTQQIYFYLIWCCHYYCNKDYVIMRNYYPCVVYAYIIKGHLNLNYQNKNYLLTEGEAFLIDYRYPHRYSGTDNLEFMFYNFAGETAFTLCKKINQQNGYVFDGKQAQLTAKLCAELMEKFQRNEIPSIPDISLNIYQILMILSEPKEKYSTNDLALEHPISKAISYMHDHFKDPKLNLDHLAQKTNLSKFHFSHLFKQRMACSPKEYILNLRINHAKFLLKNTSYSIEHIATEIGYANTGSFTNYFTKKVGLSPLYFRKASV